MTKVHPAAKPACDAIRLYSRVTASPNPAETKYGDDERDRVRASPIPKRGTLEREPRNLSGFERLLYPLKMTSGYRERPNPDKRFRLMGGDPQ